MADDIHKRAAQMWLRAKSQNIEANPSAPIFRQLTGRRPTWRKQPDSLIDLCREINITRGLPSLTAYEAAKLDAGIVFRHEGKNSALNKPVNTNAVISSLILFGCLLGVISMFAGGFSWWIAGLLAATSLSFGAMKIVFQKYRQSLVSSAELIAHIIILGISLLGLIITSVINTV